MSTGSSHQLPPFQELSRLAERSPPAAAPAAAPADPPEPDHYHYHAQHQHYHRQVLLPRLGTGHADPARPDRDRARLHSLHSPAGVQTVSKKRHSRAGPGPAAPIENLLSPVSPVSFRSAPPVSGQWPSGSFRLSEWHSDSRPEHRSQHHHSHSHSQGALYHPYQHHHTHPTQTQTQTQTPTQTPTLTQTLTHSHSLPITYRNQDRTPYSRMRLPPPEGWQHDSSVSPTSTSPSRPAGPAATPPYSATSASSTHIRDRDRDTLHPAPDPAPSPAKEKVVDKVWPAKDRCQNFILRIRQQPRAARACGFGERDRRVIDPPPIVQFEIRDDKTGEVDVHSLRCSLTALHCILVDEDGETDRTIMSHPDKFSTRRLMGQTVSSPAMAKDEQDVEGCFFCFPDLSCRTNGRYRLRFVLVNSNPHDLVVGGKVEFMAEAVSEVFTVYSAKYFPGMQPSSALTRALKLQGCNIQVKKGSERAVMRQREYEQRERDQDDERDCRGGHL